MSGTVRIARGNAWTPRGWVFDLILSDIASDKELRDSRLSALALQAVEGFQYLDASDWQPDRFMRFMAAAQRCRRGRIRDGAEAFARPEFFPAFVAEIDDLIEQLELDPRALRSERGLGQGSRPREEDDPCS